MVIRVGPGETAELNLLVVLSRGPIPAHENAGEIFGHCDSLSENAGGVKEVSVDAAMRHFRTQEFSFNNLDCLVYAGRIPGLSG